MPRKPGMDRMDLLKVNAEIVKGASKKIAEYAPNATVIVVTNPLDVMCRVALRTTGFSLRRVIGMAGILDSTRFRYFIAEELGCALSSVHAMVLGGHGDEMVPLTHASNVAGIPLEDILPADRLAAIVDRTRKGGGEIVSLLKTGSAYFAPSVAVAQMVDAILKDKHLIVPASAYLSGEYGLNDLFFGVPVQLGRQGVEKIIEYKLDSAEFDALKKSAQGVAENIAKLK